MTWEQVDIKTLKGELSNTVFGVRLELWALGIIRIDCCMNIYRYTEQIISMKVYMVQDRDTLLIVPMDSLEAEVV